MKKLVIVLAIVLTGLLAERLVFSTSTVNIKLNPEVLRASTNSQLIISAEPINILGFRNILGSTNVSFVIQEGSNLIDVLPAQEKGTAIVISKGKEGEAVIAVYSLKSGLILEQVVIRILPRDYAAAF